MTEIYQQRLESLLAVDEAVAAIVAELARVGELDNTLIVYTSDNGFFHGEHRFLHGKGQVYEPAIRVPLLLRGPGLPAGATRDTLVANVDLAPTIMDVADAQPGRVMDGRSLLPLLRHRGPWKRRDLLVQNRHRVRFDAIRTPRYVYAEYGNGERELYDLRRDPHQLTSKHRSPAYQARRKELARRLALLRP